MPFDKVYKSFIESLGNGTDQIKFFAEQAKEDIKSNLPMEESSDEEMQDKINHSEDIIALLRPNVVWKDLRLNCINE